MSGASRRDRDRIKSNSALSAESASIQAREIHVKRFYVVFVVAIVGSRVDDEMNTKRSDCWH